jgi:hypothetical protein
MNAKCIAITDIEKLIAERDQLKEEKYKLESKVNLLAHVAYCLALNHEEGTKPFQNYIDIAFAHKKEALEE